MLQRQAFQEHLGDEEHGTFLTPAHIFDLLKRRVWHFAIPFVVLLVIGTAVTLLWPATYLAEGKILVESPQIPSDLVRPTVAILASERVQIIEQRIMTRDNLLGLAKKYGLTEPWGSRVSGTDLVDFIRGRTQIRPLELKIQNPNIRKDTQAIAFTVGFEYERPGVAVKVANELLTMLLNEDVRGRTNSATETTRFLDQEVKRLQGQLSLIDTQIASLTTSRNGALVDARTGIPLDLQSARSAASTPSAASVGQTQDEKQLAALKAELLVRSATLSPEHPDIKALKRRIEAFEKTVDDAKKEAEKAAAQDASGKSKDNSAKSDSASSSASSAGAAADTNGVASKSSASANAAAVGLDALITQKVNLNLELRDVTQKLSAARLGESLERGQYAERLQVIEQPVMPDQPIRPNRPKLFGFAIAIALMMGGGIALAAEVFNPAIRRSTDLYSIIDSHLVVSIPYITTQGELQRKRQKLIIIAAVLLAAVLAAVAIVLFVLPPLDVLYAKILARLLG